MNTPARLRPDSQRRFLLALVAVAAVTGLLIAGLVLVRGRQAGNDEASTRQAGEATDTTPTTVSQAGPDTAEVVAMDRLAKARQHVEQVLKGERLGPRVPVKTTTAAQPPASNAAGALRQTVDVFSASPHKIPTPACETTMVDVAKMDRTDPAYFYVLSSAVNGKALRVPARSEGFCTIDTAAFGNSASQTFTVAPGPTMRLYISPTSLPEYYTNAGYLAYQFDQKEQLYEIPGRLYSTDLFSIRAVPSLDVLANTGRCSECDFRGAEIFGMRLDEYANLDRSDFSGAVLYNMDLRNASFGVSRFGIFQGNPAVIVYSDLTGALFDYAVFDSTIARDTTLEKATFEKASFSNVVFDDTVNTTGWTNKDAKFKASVLPYPSGPWSNVDFEGTSFVVAADEVAAMKGATFTNLTMRDANFLGARPELASTTWVNSDLTGSNFSNMSFNSADFTGVNARGAKFTGSSFVRVSNGAKKVSFKNAYLREANFKRASLLNADFANAKLGSTRTDGASGTPTTQGATEPVAGTASFANADLRGANFDGIDGGDLIFENAYLTPGDNAVNFNSANLRQADFNGSIMAQTKFTSATLSNAQFIKAQCISCDVAKSTVNNASFYSAYLHGTNLQDALTLDGSNFLNSACCATKEGTHSFSVGQGLSITESYKPTSMAEAKFKQSGTCPSGYTFTDSSGCKGRETPADKPISTCVSAGIYLCDLTINTLTGVGKPKGYSDGSSLIPTGSPSASASGSGSPSGLSSNAKLAKFDNPSRVLAYRYAPDAGRPGETTGIRVLVADTGNHVVRFVDGSGGDPGIAVLAGTPKVSGKGADGVPATQTRLSSPAGMAVDRFGRIYVADSGNNQIRRIDPDGLIRTVVGTGAEGDTGTGGFAKKASLKLPEGVAVACGVSPDQCLLYVADTGNNKVKLVGFDGIIRDFAGTGEAGFSGDTNPVSTDPEQGLAIKAKLKSPKAVALDSRGNLIIADTGNNRVRYVTASASKIYSWSEGMLFSKPTDIALDAADNLYIVESGSHRIRRMNIGGKDAPGIIADKGSKAGDEGDGGSALAAALDSPTGISVLESWGPYYIADAGNQKIREMR